MVRVVVVERCFIGNQLREPGEEFEFEGLVSKGGPIVSVSPPAPPVQAVRSNPPAREPVVAVKTATKAWGVLPAPDGSDLLT